jgi:protoheme IX farnesyltransferase
MTSDAQAVLSYLFLYTPLKRKTPLCTLLGAFPGAAPPLIGLVCGTRPVKSASLGALRFGFPLAVPHFMAIAWMYLKITLARDTWSCLPGSRGIIF